MSYLVLPSLFGLFYGYDWLTENLKLTVIYLVIDSRKIGNVVIDGVLRFRKCYFRS